MNLKFGLILVIAIFVVGVQPVHADDRKDIEALYAKLLASLVNNHPEETLAYETSDFVSVDVKGKTHNGTQLVEDFKKNAPLFHMGAPDMKIVKCKIKGKTAEIEANLVMSNHFVDTRGDNGPKGQAHVMEIVTSLQNSLVKTADGWRFRTLKQLSAQKMMMDGKPLVPRKKSTPTAPSKGE